MEPLARLEREAFDDWTPNNAAKLIDGTGETARAVVVIWQRATSAERAEAIAGFPSEEASVTVADALLFNTLASNLATRYADIYEVIGARYPNGPRRPRRR